METFLSLLARTTGEDRGCCPRDGLRLQIRGRGTLDVDDGPLLLGISRMLRRLRVPARLAHFQGREPEAPPCGEAAGPREHPDAADVLRTCRERHLGWHVGPCTEGGVDNGRKLVELVRRLSPNHPFLHFNFGMTYGQAGKHRKAVKSLLRSLELAQPHESQWAHETTDRCGGARTCARQVSCSL